MLPSEHGTASAELTTYLLRELETQRNATNSLTAVVNRLATVRRPSPPASPGPGHVGCRSDGDGSVSGRRRVTASGPHGCRTGTTMRWPWLRLRRLRGRCT
jgi:hypothetical protein